MSWSDNLKEQIINLLSSEIIIGDKTVLIVGNVEHRKMLTNETPLKADSRSPMDFWRACFTPAIVDPRPGHNYEVLETNGDSVIQTVTFGILSDKYPGSITDEKLTLFKSEHLSKHGMAHISRKFRLPELINPKTPDGMKNSDSMAEDILESLFGTIYSLANRVFGIGKGALIATRLALRMYGSEKFDITALQKNPTTRFKEINEALGWLDTGVAITRSAINIRRSIVDGRQVATMDIVGDRIKIGLRKRYVTKFENFATGIGDSESEATYNMYLRAIDRYREIGIDDILVKLTKRRREIDTWEADGLLVRPTIKQFYDKLTANGFNDWKFYIPPDDLYDKGSIRRFVRLIGIKEDGSLVNLNMASGRSDKSAMANAVSNYAMNRV